MNDPTGLEQRYAELAVEGVGLFGDDPARIRGHIDRGLMQWSEGDRGRLRQLLTLKAGAAPAHEGHGDTHG